MYQTLSAPSTYTLEEKRSEFIAYVFPVSNREQALKHLNDLKIEYPDARHHCWAYIIGAADHPKTVAFNDDGEPSGTAGRPILHVLTQRGAGDCCAIVVRYFGGVKLGAGGLVRAYGQAVSKALDIAQWQEVYPKVKCTIDTSYGDEPHVRHFIAESGGRIINTQYSEGVTLIAEIASSSIEKLKNDIQQKTAGHAKITFKKVSH